jgi:hypothetical protein
VLVHDGKIVGAGMNDTNKSMNVRRGAGLRQALSAYHQFFYLAHTMRIESHDAAARIVLDLGLFHFFISSSL